MAEDKKFFAEDKVFLDQEALNDVSGGVDVVKGGKPRAVSKIADKGVNWPISDMPEDDDLSAVCDKQNSKMNVIV